MRLRNKEAGTEMILRWTDRDHGQHYLQVGEHVTLLGNYGHDEPRPNFGNMYNRATFVVADPPNIKGGALVGEFGNDASAPGHEFAGTSQKSTIVHVFVPEYGGPDDGLLQISCLCMYVLNDQGDTVDTLVRQR